MSSQRRRGSIGGEGTGGAGESEGRGGGEERRGGEQKQELLLAELLPIEAIGQSHL